MADKSKSLRVKKVAVEEHLISGYTRPYTEIFLAAGAEWDGGLLAWRYKGATLPATIQNIIVGQFALNPETPMTKLLDEPAQPVGESGGETCVVNFNDVMEYWDKRRQKWTDPKFVYIGRAHTGKGLPGSRWGNKHFIQNQKPEERQRVIDAYREDLLKMDRATLHAELKKLEGKTLVCWCAPKACHGDVLVEFIKSPPPLEVEPKASAPLTPIQQWEQKVVVAETEAREALQNDVPDALDKLVKAVEIGNERPVLNPSSTICAGCGKAAMYTVERDGKPYCEECLPTPGGLPKQDAEWIKTGKPAADGDSDAWVKEVNKKARRLDQTFEANANRAASTGAAPEVIDAALSELMKREMDDFVKTASSDSIMTVEEAAQILYGTKQETKPLTYDDYKRLKTLYPNESQIVMLHIGGMWTTWDDDADNLEIALKIGQRDVRRKVKAVVGLDTSGRRIASYHADFYTNRFEEAVCSGALMTLVLLGKDGEIRVLEPKAVEVQPDVTEILDEGLTKLNEFIDSKKSEITVENPSEAPQNIDSNAALVDVAQSVENVTEARIASKLTFAEGQLVGCETLRGRVLSSDVFDTYVMTGSPERKNRWNTVDVYPVYDEPAFEKDDAVKDMFDDLWWVVWSNGYETMVKKWGDDSKVAKYFTASLRHAETTHPPADDNRITDVLKTMRDTLRKPRPESEIPFVALYISGAENVGLLFAHYVEAIRLDDPDMNLGRAKELAAAVLLYQYQQEWVSTDVEAKYPEIFEAFKAAAKGEILIAMLLRISGLSNIVEVTYNDDLMEHIVDVVAQTPF